MSSPKARPWLSNTDRLAALGDWVSYWFGYRYKEQ